MSFEGIADVMELARSVDIVHIDEPDVDTTKTEKCNKDTGDDQKVLRKWSRGLLHFVRGGGHIEKWSPLYKYVQKNHVYLQCLELLSCI